MARMALSARFLGKQDEVITTYLGHILDLLEPEANGKLLDLGCGPGVYTLMFASRLAAKEVIGLDVDTDALIEASSRGIQVVHSDLDSALPFPDNSFGVVIATQVIEHLHHPDKFADEVSRVLAPGGYAIIATENLASWHNIVALALGYQPFTDNVSEILRIGNPFMRNYMKKPHFDMLHVKVFTLFSLVEFLQVHGLFVNEIRTDGYPLAPASLARLLSRVDPRHARYLIVKARKDGSKRLHKGRGR